MHYGEDRFMYHKRFIDGRMVILVLDASQRHATALAKHDGSSAMFGNKHSPTPPRTRTTQKQARIFRKGEVLRP